MAGITIGTDAGAKAVAGLWVGANDGPKAVHTLWVGTSAGAKQISYATEPLSAELLYSIAEIASGEIPDPVWFGGFGVLISGGKVPYETEWTQIGGAPVSDVEDFGESITFTFGAGGGEVTFRFEVTDSDGADESLILSVGSN